MIILRYLNELSHMPLTLEQYADYLDKQDLSWPAAPTVERPKAKPHLKMLPEVRCVCWDIYGTLLSISGGELTFEHPTKFIMDLALDKTLQEFKMWGSMTRKPGQPAEYLGQLYRKALSDLRLVSSPGEKFPEIQADRIWLDIVKKLLHKDYKFAADFFGSLNEYCKKIAHFFHASLQGTGCYEDAAKTMRFLAAQNIRQGVLADSQCFTMVQLQRGLAVQDDAARIDDLIEPELRALSHEFGARKPSERLFKHWLQLASQRGLAPEQILHVGSSMDEDIIPARKLGMRTALFAGDKASLKASAEQLKDNATRPDILVTELTQITKVVT